jgi:heterodisulfide reductase subunit A
MVNASGPTGGSIKLRNMEDVPERIAILHCIGSRDKNYHEYCSNVCCMYSLKFAHLVREKLPDATCHEFYIDMRAFGKGYEEFAERIKAEGTHVVRGRTAKVTKQDGAMVVRGEDILSARMLDLPVDMVVLSVALVPAAGSAQLGEQLGVASDQYGWFSELDYNADPTDTERGGVFVAGACQAPKDIPDTVAQASSVAAGVLKSIAVGRGVREDAELSLDDIKQRAAHLVQA